jgi:hypothetical protein
MKSLVALTFFGSVALICAQPAHATLLADEEAAGTSIPSENIITDDFGLPQSRLHHAHGGPVKSLYQRQQDRQARQTHARNSRPETGLHSGLHSGLGLHSRTRDCTASRRHPCPDPVDGVPADTTTTTIVAGNPILNPPTGNLGESDPTGDIYNSLVTARHHRILPVTPVPEPGSLLLLAIGATALAMARRRNRPN